MTKDARLLAIEEKIGSHLDFPNPGILFRDFFPVLRSPQLFEDTLQLFSELLSKYATNIHYIAGIEARGFVIGPALALKLKVPFIPIRKPGKLPGNVKKQAYNLEYGTDALEIQVDAVQPGSNVVIVDDLIATGGSMEASVKLVKSIGGDVVCCLVAMELCDLKGRENVSAPLHSLVQF